MPPTRSSFPIRVWGAHFASAYELPHEVMPKAKAAAPRRLDSVLKGWLNPGQGEPLQA